MSLKALARAVLSCNQERNQDATCTEKPRNFSTEKTPEKLRVLADIKEAHDSNHTELDRIKSESITRLYHLPTKRPPAEALACFGIGFRWTMDHLPELMAAGWTRRELFRRGRYSWPLGNEWGLAWADSWQDGRKAATVGKHGKIIFSFLTANGEQAHHTVTRWPGN